MTSSIELAPEREQASREWTQKIRDTIAHNAARAAMERLVQTTIESGFDDPIIS